ncbi:MAG: hypothetical protein OHK0039_26060 [Bacteroidia bacterium]
MRSLRLLPHYLLLLGIFLAGSLQGVQAQNFQISGTVIANNGMLLPSYPVDINILVGGAVVQVSTNTDSTGVYGFYMMSPIGSQGTVVVSAPSCNGPVYDSAFFNIATTQLTIDLVVCPTPSGFCQAAFNYVPQAGGTVSFINYSTPGAYLWDFGDGNQSTNFSPVHTYIAAGVYTACLYVTDSLCSDSFCVPVVVDTTSLCDASFTYATTGGPLVNFFVNPLPNTLYQWDFGDSTYSTDPNPGHQYQTSGIFQACLTVTDTLQGCTATHCEIIYVAGQNLCQADFSFDTLGGNVVSFTDLSSGSSPGAPLIYHWDFGDGNYDSTSNPVHTYGQGGIYVVCLTITDPLISCTTSACYVVVIGSGSNCAADFTTVPLGNQMVVFQPTNFPLLIPGLMYHWDFGTGDTSNSPVAVHTFPATGTYLVCLTVTDFVNNCSQTFCDSVVVSSVGNNCVGDFIWNVNANGVYTFTNLSVSANPAATYFWDFGDGTTSTLTDPTHTFSGTGPWLVCLTLFDPVSFCQTTTCQLIAGSGNPGSGFQVSGAVFADSSLIFNGIVYLVQHDSVSGALTAIDSTFIGGSFYSFYGVPAGTYLIKAALLPGSPVYADYLPTYLGDELFWYNAVSTVVANGNVLNPPIHLVPGNNPGGPGFIGGLVSQGANKQEGDPLANVSVLLFDQAGQAVSHTVTDSEGKYYFGGLNWGTYKVYVEMMNRYGEPWIVTIGPGNPGFEGADFEAGTYEVTPSGTTAIATGLLAETLSLYPNPASDRLYVEFSLEQARPVAVQVLNMMGQRVAQQQVAGLPGLQRIAIATQGLPAGTYVVRIETEQGQISRRVLVAHE